MTTLSVKMNGGKATTKSRRMATVTTAGTENCPPGCGSSCAGGRGSMAATDERETWGTRATAVIKDHKGRGGLKDIKDRRDTLE